MITNKVHICFEVLLIKKVRSPKVSPCQKQALGCDLTSPCVTHMPSLHRTDDLHEGQKQTDETLCCGFIMRKELLIIQPQASIVVTLLKK